MKIIIRSLILSIIIFALFCILDALGVYMSYRVQYDHAAIEQSHYFRQAIQVYLFYYLYGGCLISWFTTWLFIAIKKRWHLSQSKGFMLAIVVYVIVATPIMIFMVVYQNIDFDTIRLLATGLILVASLNYLDEKTKMAF